MLGLVYIVAPPRPRYGRRRVAEKFGKGHYSVDDDAQEIQVQDLLMLAEDAPLDRRNPRPTTLLKAKTWKC